jgi:hypothetical protein
MVEVDAEFSNMSLLKVVVLPFAMLILGMVDADTVYWSATIVGAVVGSVIFTEQLAETTKIRTLAIILSGAFVGGICGSFITWYFNMLAWQEILFINFICGFLGLQSAKTIFKIHQTQFQKRIEAKLNKELGEFDGSTHSEPRSKGKT